MKLLIATLICFFPAIPLSAQTKPARLHFALLEHSGSLTLEPTNWAVTELSAKSNGNEIGIRAKSGDIGMLGFLFVWPEKAHLTSASCRDEMLRSEKVPANLQTNMREITSQDGTKIALVSLNPPPKGKETWHFIRAFVASGDLCADISFSSKQAINDAAVERTLNTLKFDPQAQPGFSDALFYATILWEHHTLDSAAKAYEVALSRVDGSDNPAMWRRVVVDQLAMSYGMAGDLKRSRAINETAIAKDPDYPLYYYNLACADAEEGNAASAREHLKNAFDRRANTLPNEKLPDPATDDSFLKLKGDKQFWSFVQDISTQEKN
jgi:tetratricopeptide (TPR) repeat protein